MATDPLIDDALAVFDQQVPDAEAQRTTPVTDPQEAVDWHKKQVMNWMMTVQQTAGAGAEAARAAGLPVPGRPLPPGGMTNLKLNVGGKNGN